MQMLVATSHRWQFARKADTTKKATGWRDLGWEVPIIMRQHEKRQSKENVKPWRQPLSSDNMTVCDTVCCTVLQCSALHCSVTVLSGDMTRSS